MLDNEREYLNATKHAQINIDEKDKSTKNKLIIINLLMSAVLLYIGFMYLKSKTDIFSTFTHKQAVLGVSETIDDSVFSEEELMKILKVSKMDDSEGNSMKVLMNESSIKSQASYTEAISRVLDDKSGFRGRIVVVKQEETSSE